MLLFIKGHSTGYALVSYFNTSHVTVYRVVGLFESKKRLFQYISCYCLSVKFLFQLINIPKFQYISCYCLSASSDIACTFVFHFNTSHVTVYRISTTNESHRS